MIEITVSRWCETCHEQHIQTVQFSDGMDAASFAALIEAVSDVRGIPMSITVSERMKDGTRRIIESGEHGVVQA